MMSLESNQRTHAEVTSGQMGAEVESSLFPLSCHGAV